MCYDILTSYFSEKDIDDLSDLMTSEDEYRRDEYTLNQQMQAAKSSVLKQWVKEWDRMAQGDEARRDTVELLKKKAMQELKRRRHIFG